MRATLFLGLLAVASAAVTSCTDDQTAPTRASVLAFGSTGTSCDPTHTECPPPPPPPECDPHDPCPPPPPCDPHDPCNFIEGRMTGGGGQVQITDDIWVSRGFTIHCDITLSNNLEINWPGNKWHIDKPLTSALCVDSPAIAPEPPAAPFDTFIGEGLGRLNGVDGSLVKFTFADAGERGNVADFASIQVFDQNGNLVLDVPFMEIKRGNVQAHYDQPHKNK